MKPIEMYYADSKIKAKIRENELMEVFNNNLNSVRAYRNEEEKKEYVKEYYKNNLEIYKDITSFIGFIFFGSLLSISVIFIINIIYIIKLK